MITFARRIWGSDDTELAAARAAGWRRADLVWERWQERGHEALRSGDLRAAMKFWRRAARIARWRIPPGDPRGATSVANLAFAARLAGREEEARRLYRRAAALWLDSAAMVERMQVAPRARSSLFHLRMEMRHADTFRENVRRRMRAFMAETTEALAALEKGEVPEGRFHGRWRAEKPPYFDDSRKILAACLLIATPGED